MVFSSFLFLSLFLPAFLGAYYACPDRLKNHVALAASLLFYAWGAPQLVLYLVAACAVDYAASLWIARDWSRPSVPKWITGAVLAVDVAFLAWFKYANFFVHEMNRLFSGIGIAPVAWSGIALPIGISFFTFHRITYIVDVCRRTTPPARSYADYLLYVVLFPQLIAGPIIRYHDVAADIARRAHSLDLFFQGMTRFALGLGKKVLLANVLGEAADRVFEAAPSAVTFSQAWLGALCYAFQIYFDFSGYSDMAIGLARMIGIRFRENFDLPYTSRSITEFWRRWHISLSLFMRDYLYIPLGGNRAGRARTYFNLWVVFLVSGFWHGAGWNFLLWGAWHGFFLAVDLAFWADRVRKIPKAAGIALTFVVVLFGWVLFRSPDLGSALQYASRMLGLATPVPGAESIPWPGPRILFVLVVAAAISFLPASEKFDRWRTRWAAGAGTGFKFAGVTALTLLSLAYLSSSSFNPFIYFRF